MVLPRPVELARITGNLVPHMSGNAGGLNGSASQSANGSFLYGRMARGRILREAGLRLSGRSCYSRVDPCHLRSKADPPITQGLGRRRAKARWRDFCRREDYRASDILGLIRALSNLSQKASEWDWTNRVCFLRV